MPSLYCLERVCFVVCVCTHTFICVFHPINMISVPLVPPCILMSSSSSPSHSESTLLKLIMYPDFLEPPQKFK